MKMKIDQDCRHANIWKNPFKNLLLNRRADFNETWYVASGAPVHYSLFNDGHGVTLTYFTASFVT